MRRKPTLRQLLRRLERSVESLTEVQRELRRRRDLTDVVADYMTQPIRDLHAAADMLDEVSSPTD